MAESKQAPSDHAAERAVLGAILSEPSTLGDVAGVLDAGDFDLPAHRVIFAACLEMAEAGKELDQLTLSAALRSSGKLTEAGGPAYLSKLQGEAYTTSNAVIYAKLVKAASIKRQVLGACRDLAALSVEPSTESDDLLDEAQRRMFALAERRGGSGLVPMREVLDQTFELIDKIRESGGGLSGLSTGFVDLDHMLTGLHPGELVILAARPGVGKTALALNMAAHVAIKSKVGVAFFSMEMPNEQLAMRLLAAETRVDLRRIREGSLSSAHMEKIGHAAERLFAASLFVDDSGALSSFDLRTKVRRLQNRLSTMDPPVNLGLVVIDYLQLMHQRGRAESRHQEVQEISRSLKALAKELSLPIVALSQLNRKVEERRGKNGKPMLSDLRESGAIEQDADVVMFVHKEQASGDDDGAQDEIELIVAKQRNGPTGVVPLVFLGDCTRFESKARVA